MQAVPVGLSAEERVEMLEEAVGVIRELWTGSLVNHRGKHYTVDHARLYEKPPGPIPMFPSGFLIRLWRDWSTCPCSSERVPS